MIYRPCTGSCLDKLSRSRQAPCHGIATRSTSRSIGGRHSSHAGTLCRLTPARVAGRRGPPRPRPARHDRGGQRSGRPVRGHAPLWESRDRCNKNARGAGGQLGFSHGAAEFPGSTDEHRDRRVRDPGRRVSAAGEVGRGEDGSEISGRCQPDWNLSPWELSSGSFQRRGGGPRGHLHTACNPCNKARRNQRVVGRNAQRPHRGVPGWRGGEALPDTL